MPISAKILDVGASLEQIRQEFNNLQSDVNILQQSPTYGDSLIFEGATSDAYETTLSVQDPTADRTVLLPNEDGTLLLDSAVINATTSSIVANNTTNETVYITFVDGASGNQGLESDTSLTYNPSTNLLTTGNIVIADAGNIGSASDTDAISISSGGAIQLTQSLTVAGATTHTGTTTHNEDVTFTGAANNAVWDKSDNALEFADSAKAIFGTGGDLEIFHDGSHSYINDNGTGQLRLQGSQISLMGGTDGAETMATFVDNGAAALYYDNGAKLQTSAAGVSVTGTATMSANIVIADAGSIGSASDTNAITISSGGVVAVTATTAATFPTNGALTVGGGLGVADDIVVGDNIVMDSDGAILYFGDGQDVFLTHVHDTGILLNSTRQIQFGDAGTYIHQSADGVLDLVSDTELELNATTIDINGNVEISGTTAQVGVATFTARDIHSGGITIADDGQIGSASDLDAMTISAAGVVTFTVRDIHNAGITIANDGTIGSVGDADAITISSGGVVTFSQTPVFSSDLTLGDDLYLDSDGAVIHFGDDGDVELQHIADTGLRLLDNDKMLFGSSSDLQIYHDSTDSVIFNQTGEFKIRAGTLKMMNSAGNENMIYATENGAVTLYNDNAAKLATLSTGVSITGNLVPASADGGALGGASNEWSDLYLADGGVIYFGVDQDVALTHVHDTGLRMVDGDKLMFGSSDDLKIFHDGSNSYVQDSGTGALYLAASALHVTNNDATESIIYAVENGAVNLYYDNAVKLATTSAGVSVTGTYTGTGLMTTGGNIVIPDAGTIGSASDTDAITISAAGVVTFSQTPVLGSDLNLADDLFLDSDGSVIHFGDDGDVTLTHVADTGLRLEDSDKMLFGTGADLEIYHDGTHSFVADTGTGQLRLLGSQISLMGGADGAETMATFVDNGAVALYYDNAAKLATTAAGVTVSGSILIADGGNIGSASDADSLAIDASGNITASQNVTVTGNLTVNGTTTTVSTSNTVIGDSLIELNSGAGSNANDLGIVMERGSTGDNVIFLWDESGDHFSVGTTTATGASTGNLTYTLANFSAASIVGTLTTAAQTNITSLGTLTALTVDNVAINGATIGHTGDTDLMTLASAVLTVAGRVDVADDIYLTGDEKAIRFYNGSNYVTVQAHGSLSSNLAFKLPQADGSAGQAMVTDASGNLSFAANNVGNATSFTTVANNSTDETVYPVFVDGATGEQGPETDTGLTYNPSTGLLSTALLTITSSTDQQIDLSGGAANPYIRWTSSSGGDEWIWQNVGGSSFRLQNSTDSRDDISIDGSGTVTLAGGLTVGGTTTLNGNLVLGDAAADTLTVGATLQGASPLTFEGGTADGNETTFAITDPTADRTITFPDATGTVVLSGAVDVNFTGANYNALWDTSADAMHFNDNAKAKFGTGSDLSIFHDGSNSYIQDSGTGALYLATSLLHVTNNDATESIIYAAENGGVNLYYDNSKKLETFTDGVRVAGHLNPLSADGGGLGSASLEWSDLFLADGSTIQFGADQDVVLTHIADTGISIGGHVRLGDSKMLQLGDSQDLSISHNGSDSYIDEGGTGALIIQSNQTKIMGAGGGETMALFNDDGAVTLYYDNTAKIATTATGVSVTGVIAASDNMHLRHDGVRLHFGVNDDVYLEHIHDVGLRMPDGDKLRFGDGDDLEIYHDGSNSALNHTGTGDFYIQSDQFYIRSASTSENMINMTVNAGVHLNFNGADVFRTLADGWQSNDNLIGKFGSSGDMQLYHDATNSVIFNQTGELRVRAGTFRVMNANQDETMALFAQDGAASLYYDNAVKFQTLTGGASVTGSLSVSGGLIPAAADGGSLGTAALEFSDLFLADASTIQFGNDQDVTLTHVADTGLLLNSTRQIQFNDASQYICGATATQLDIRATDEIELTATLVDLNGNLDVSGTSALAGAVTLTGGIGVLSAAGSDSSGSIGVKLPNEKYIAWFDSGTSGGTSASIRGVGGAVSFGGSSYTFTGDVTTDFNGNVTLSHDGAVLYFGNDSEINLEHVADHGLKTNGHINMLDNKRLYVGTGNDLEIYHSGSHSYINDAGTGNLYLGGDNLALTSAGTTESYLQAVKDGAVSLYYDNAVKLATDAAGVNITGDLDVSANGTWTGRPSFNNCATANHDDMATATGSLGAFEVHNTGVGNDAFMAFHAAGDIALYFGLDADTNNLAVGGWSLGAAKYQIIHTGRTDGIIVSNMLGADCITGAKIGDDQINSEHYAADSIDEEHLANDCVGSAELKSLSTLLIKNSSGTTLKTFHGAGA